VLARGVVEPSEEVMQALKLEKRKKTIMIRRLRILEDTPLMLEDIYLPEEIFNGFDQVDISQKLLYPIYESKYKTPITWAEEFLKPLIADQEAAAYLGIAPGRAVIAIERIAYTLEDRPVEFRKSLGRGDQFSYHIEIR
jgi:GntR family transcriptional regulator